MKCISLMGPDLNVLTYFTRVFCKTPCSMPIAWKVSGCQDAATAHVIEGLLSEASGVEV